MHLRSSERKILEEAFNRVIDKWCLDSYGVLDISEDSELALVLGAVSKFLPIPILSRDNIPIILQNFFVRKVNEYEQANPRPSYPSDTVISNIDGDW